MPAQRTVRIRLAGLAIAALVLAATGCAADPGVITASPTIAASPTPTTSHTAAAPATAAATASPAPVTVEELGRGEQEAAVDVEVTGPAQVAFRRITIAPGAGTGQHCHDGQLIAVVEQGVFTHYAPIYPGGVHEYQAGDSIVEGAHYVHEGRNEGTEDVVLLVSYVIEAGQPLAETDLTKCDAP
ncbi:cupin domain-containing protein [Herbiconiux moechotypicola]|uniref:Cupin type-2 domain-containing protein n=1 Tax=Herbiconiux moechotypicola TaxID=637393 RepID=A0ABN3D8K5_9MICO|nr:cupin domain-containing protein [Herbiconiux moechotypicola]MCS5728239.1 cupin domain-containing protein [Herbiconiux moechotypicola]